MTDLLTRGAGLLLMVSLIGACDDVPPQRTAERTAGESAPAELLQMARSQVPELRSEPLPEPQPNGSADPSTVPDRVRSALEPEVLSRITGEATFYADRFEGRRTASGLPFRQNQMVAAHRAYPFGTVLRVTNLDNQRAVNVRVVDRGPFGGAQKAHRPVIDLSRRAAQELGYVEAGRARVKVEVLEWGTGLPRTG